jgi:hypothetical protein
VKPHDYAIHTVSPNERVHNVGLPTFSPTNLTAGAEESSGTFVGLSQCMLKPREEYAVLKQTDQDRYGSSRARQSGLSGHLRLEDSNAAKYTFRLRSDQSLVEWLSPSSTTGELHGPSVQPLTIHMQSLELALSSPTLVSRSLGRPA